MAAFTPAAAHATAHPLTVGDYGGDHKTDLTVFRPSNGTWYSIDSASGGGWSMGWGQAADIPVSGDYSDTPDGITDTMVFRPSTGVWYFADSVTFSSWWQQWGGEGDIPISGDWDGDGVTDLAIWRHFTNSGYPAGMWWIINSHDWSVTTQQLGQEGDIPVPCDYDGDGKSDFAVFRPSDDTWHVLFSGWANDGPSVYNWGVAGSIPIPGDYDGDGKTDMVVWRPSNGTWYGIRSSDGGRTSVQWGSGGPNNGGIGSDVALPNNPGSVDMIDDLDVPQQQYNWCWAATAQMAAAYSAVTINQCDLANARFGRTDCCTDPSSASDPTLCNQPGWWDQLTSYGFTYDSTDWGTALSFTDLQSQLNANHPVPYAWGWTGGGGHAMVAVKTWVDGSTGTQWVSINNPDPVNVGEQDDMTYSYWVSASNHVHWQDSYNLVLQ